MNRQFQYWCDYLRRHGEFEFFDHSPKDWYEASWTVYAENYIIKLIRDNINAGRSPFIDSRIVIAVHEKDGGINSLLFMWNERNFPETNSNLMEKELFGLRPIL